MESKIKFLAYYLPQYHPIPENDKWWGKGFTEWTNVTKAKPLFKNHYQPILPSDLGFYDLRVPEVQEQQSELALSHGVDGFIYYQYWFGPDKMLLEKPAESMLKNQKVKIPFCFCWANETWKGIWHGLENPDILIEQKYPSKASGYKQYFDYLLPFFQDERYIKVDNKPMFHVYRVSDLPDRDLFFQTFNSLAKKNGFDGIYFVITTTAESVKKIDHELISAKIDLNIFNNIRYHFQPFFTNRWLRKIELKINTKLGYTQDVVKRNKPLILEYPLLMKHFNKSLLSNKSIPCAIPNWDNSPRSNKKSMILNKTSPKAWKNHLEQTVQLVKEAKNNPQYVILKSWNEWAEGNYLEPDRKYGREWLKVVKEVKESL